jgi:hypothetical protein
MSKNSIGEEKLIKLVVGRFIPLNKAMDATQDILKFLFFI